MALRRGRRNTGAERRPCDAAPPRRAASGKAGCNAYGASWEMHADGRAKFGAAMSTKMACLTPAGAIRVERGVLDALQHPVHLRRNGGTLVLLDASDKPLAKLAPEDAP